MKAKYKELWKRFAACTVVLAIIFSLMLLFYAVTHTDKQEIILNDTKSQKYGWSYFIWDGTEEYPTELQYEDEYNFTFTVSASVHALRINRVMTEASGMERITISPYSAGIDVFLGEELLYSDFLWTPRAAEQYLPLSFEEMERFLNKDRTISVSLPYDYSGKTLSVTYYYPENMEIFYLTSAMFPRIGSLMTDSAPAVAESAVTAMAVALCGIMVLILTGIFLFNIHGGRYEWSIILMALYYLFKIVEILGFSLLGHVSLYSSYLVRELPWGFTVLLLLLFFGVYFFSGWRKKAALVLCGLLGIFYMLYLLNCLTEEIVQYMQNALPEMGMILCFLILWILEYRKRPEAFQKHLHSKSVMGVALVVLLMSKMESVHVDKYGMYWESMLIGITYGNMQVPVQLIRRSAALIVTIFLIVKFVREVLETRRQMNEYQVRSQVAIESYGQIRKAATQVRELKHELRHHVLVLSGLLNNHNYEKATAYVKEMEEEINELPPLQYCRNLLVNMIAAAYSERLKKNHIRFTYRLILPETLSVRDIDLSMIMTNILENAVEACEKLPEYEESYVNLFMYMKGSLLYIESVNSAPGKLTSEKDSILTTSKKNLSAHGYGMKIIKKIAEKYDGYVEVKYLENQFHIKLYINEAAN